MVLVYVVVVTVEVVVELWCWSGGDCGSGGGAVVLEWWWSCGVGAWSLIEMDGSIELRELRWMDGVGAALIEVGFFVITFF